MIRAAILAALVATPVAAQPACGPHAAVAAHLAERWGETRQSIALSNDGTVVEVWASLETGTWTITVTQPGGPACLVASGQAYQPVSEPLPPAGEEM